MSPEQSIQKKENNPEQSQSPNKADLLTLKLPKAESLIERAEIKGAHLESSRNNGPRDPLSRKQIANIEIDLSKAKLFGDVKTKIELSSDKSFEALKKIAEKVNEVNPAGPLPREAATWSSEQRVLKQAEPRMLKLQQELKTAGLTEAAKLTGELISEMQGGKMSDRFFAIQGEFAQKHGIVVDPGFVLSPTARIPDSVYPVEATVTTKGTNGPLALVVIDIPSEQLGGFTFGEVGVAFVNRSRATLGYRGSGKEESLKAVVSNELAHLHLSDKYPDIEFTTNQTVPGISSMPKAPASLDKQAATNLNSLDRPTIAQAHELISDAVSAAVAPGDMERVLAMGLINELNESIKDATAPTDGTENYNLSQTVVVNGLRSLERSGISAGLNNELKKIKGSQVYADYKQMGDILGAYVRLQKAAQAGEFTGLEGQALAKKAVKIAGSIANYNKVRNPAMMRGVGAEFSRTQQQVYADTFTASARVLGNIGAEGKESLSNLLLHYSSKLEAGFEKK